LANGMTISLFATKNWLCLWCSVIK